MKLLLIFFFIYFTGSTFAQNYAEEADSLRNEGLLMPALEKYAHSFSVNPSPEISYRISSTCALLWTKAMRDTAFRYLNYALKEDSSLQVLFDADFLSLIDDTRWKEIETSQFHKYEAKNGPIKNEPFARELFRMIIKDQGLMYAGNIERKKYIQNGGYFSTPLIILPVPGCGKNNHQPLLLL